jgi:hypothetical protein
VLLTIGSSQDLSHPVSDRDELHNSSVLESKMILGYGAQVMGGQSEDNFVFVVGSDRKSSQPC